jgi:hypothetical protein
MNHEVVKFINWKVCCLPYNLMHNFWSKKVGYFVKDVREDDAHDDDVSDRKKKKKLLS